MHTSRPLCPIAAIAFLLLGGLGIAASQDDPYFAVQTDAAGTNFVRQAEIEALADVSSSHCVLILSDGEDIRVFQKCSEIAAQLPDKNLMSFPNEFGTVFVAPSSIYDMLSTTSSGCHLNLKGRKYVSVTKSCASVHQSLPRE